MMICMIDYILLLICSSGISGYPHIEFAKHYRVSLDYLCGKKNMEVK